MNMYSWLPYYQNEILSARWMNPPRMNYGDWWLVWKFFIRKLIPWVRDFTMSILMLISDNFPYNSTVLILSIKIWKSLPIFCSRSFLFSELSFVYSFDLSSARFKSSLLLGTSILWCSCRWLELHGSLHCLHSAFLMFMSSTSSLGYQIRFLWSMFSCFLGKIGNFPQLRGENWIYRHISLDFALRGLK